MTTPQKTKRKIQKDRAKIRFNDPGKETLSHKGITIGRPKCSGPPEELKEKLIAIAEKRKKSKRYIYIGRNIKIKEMGHENRKKHIVPHIKKINYSDPAKNEIYNGQIKVNVTLSIMNRPFVTSVSLKKNILALWIVMMDKIHQEHTRVIQDFIETVVLKRWRGNTARGLGDFITKCMIHSMLEADDYEMFKNVYLSLTDKVKEKLTKKPEHFLPRELRPADTYKKI